MNTDSNIVLGIEIDIDRFGYIKKLYNWDRKFWFTLPVVMSLWGYGFVVFSRTVVGRIMPSQVTYEPEIPDKFITNSASCIFAR